MKLVRYGCLAAVCTAYGTEPPARMIISTLKM